MYTYNPASTIADEFINHEEILETLAYADENKNNEALIDSILEKAKLRKGLTHREASVLLACQSEEKNQEIYHLAEQIKKRLLWKPYCYVCSALSFQLLYQWMYLLSLSCKE